MTGATKNHPRSGWQQDEVELLFRAVHAAGEEGRPLREVFSDVGAQLKRKPNSIRNFYYAKLREAPEGANRQPPFRTFSQDEIEELMRQVLMGRGQGESVRACVTRLAGGDRAQMLRYQNKYRSILKNRPEMLMETAGELRREGLPCPENVINTRSYGGHMEEAEMAMRLKKLKKLPGMETVLRGLMELAMESGEVQKEEETEKWHSKWVDAQREADRLRVEVDLLKIALEDKENEGETAILSD